MKKLFTTTLLIAAGLSAEAALIQFDFAPTSGSNQTGLDLDGFAAGSSIVTESGFTVTLSASANTGVFNYTSSRNFGINAAALGDGTDEFDAGSGISEVMTFSFATSPLASISLVSIDFDRFTVSGLDQGSLAFSGGNTFLFDGSDVSGLGLLTVNEPISAGQVITLSHLAGDGFGIEAITLEVTPVSVPDPGPGIPLLAGLFVAGLLVQRRTLRTSKGL